MALREIFPKATVLASLSSTEKDELFEELVESIYSSYPKFDRREALERLNAREAKMTTGIMHSVAVPHALIPSMTGTIGAVGISRDGIDYDSLDKSPVHAVFMVIGNEAETERHVQVLRQLAAVLEIPNFVTRLLSLKSSSEIHDFICNSEESLLN